MPVFWFLIILAAFALWAALFFLFPAIGKFFSKWFSAIKKTLLDDKDKEEKE